MQIIDRVLQEEPARGRVDQTMFFLISKAKDARAWVDNYCSLNPQSRIPIVFSFDELESKRSESWFVRSAMMQQLYSRDLFKEQLPIVSDLFFFGRDQIVAEFNSAIRLSENRGLFGLRKTGKTSVLFKVRRIARESGFVCLYYDCKSPAVRNLTWTQFLLKIIEDLYEAIGEKKGVGDLKDAHVTERFRAAISAVSKTRRAALIFDEIEWISHLAILDVHWRNEFVPFWQTMWTTQSEVRALSLIIAGVNPTVVEVDSIGGVQNPVFGIVSPRYLRGLEEREIRALLHLFGKRMGLVFDVDAVKYLTDRYGGHPLLIRMACSYTNTIMFLDKSERPAAVSAESLATSAEEREVELSFYCRHIVSELRSFYPDEYLMLEMLASGNAADFIEVSVEQEYIRHLSHYGLIDRTRGRQPKVAIPVLSRFINLERMKTENRGFELYVIPSQSRGNWLANRVRRITDDVRPAGKTRGGCTQVKAVWSTWFPRGRAVQQRASSYDSG
jgi:hypothetical protein